MSRTIPILVTYRNKRISDLAELARTAASHVGLSADDGARLSVVVGQERSAMFDLIKQAHGGNPGYEIKDLPVDIANEWEEMRHWLRVLQLMYGDEAE